ncbi:MAG: ABC transporter ATP-binding protein [Verrucomicrobia subdivision 3 bacterium]|nr:ABC transporter ATP-binding protein [Limisphaerales bacterium]
MRVGIQSISKNFGAAAALRDVSLGIEPHELFFLLGPSGCGKTTLLRLIAGFHAPDSGQLFFDDKPMFGVPPHRRNTGMVFQNYALWPHMTVAENVAYGLDVRSVPSEEKKRRVGEALEIVRMSAYSGRTPNQLSGGQQQRVALARALVIRPDVLLLDEPLSNLDAKLRLEMREEIRRIHAETRITTIYVTHDQKEALSLADRIAVMQDGRIEQVGDPRRLYREPASRFVADFMGETNWFSAEVSRNSGGGVVFNTEIGTFVGANGTGSFSPGQRIMLGFRPEAVEFGVAGENSIQTTIADVSYLGDVEQYGLKVASGRVVKAFERNPTDIRQAGTQLVVHVRPENLLILPEK